jgi:rhamnosyl/mannosyltransferase
VSASPEGPGDGRGPLRVCHLAKYYPPAAGGIETHVRTLARAQAALGAEVTVIAVNEATRRGGAAHPLAPTWTRLERDRGVEVVRLGRVASIAKLDLPPGAPRAIRRVRPDVFHLHVPNPTMLVALAVSRPGAPLVVTWHSDIVAQPLRAAALRPVERWALGRAARIVSTSAAYATGSEPLRAHSGKVTVLPFGIDLHPFTAPGPAVQATADRLRRAHGEPLWLAVGRLVYYKGLETALGALPRVPGRLVVVGTGPLEGALRRRAAALGVADRVVWLGQVDEATLAGCYRAATALWFPSNARSEAFGLAQVEAMASGCPVLNADVPGSGVAWVSRGGESGLTVPVDDPAALATAARRLLDEPGLRARLAEGARARARAEFDHLGMARRTLDLYREVLAEAGAAAWEVAPG